jgi:polysaccharide biosynthesis protein PslG
VPSGNGDDRALRKTALLALLVQFGCSSAGVPPASGDVAFPIGVSPGSGFEQAFAKMSVGKQRAVLDLMKADGVSWLRIDYYANDSGLRHFIESAQRDGIKVDVILEDYDATPEQFAIFARDAAAQLGSAAYEILNEVNLYKPAIPAAQYVPVLQAVYNAIKQSAPHATVLASGLGPATGSAAPDRYLEAMYESGARGYFDAANLHPYSFPAPPMSSPCQSWNTFCHGAPAMRAVMVKHNDGDRPIWFTEFGCPTGTGGGYRKACTDAQLAAQLTQAYAQSRTWGWVGSFFVFDWQDNDVDGDFGLYLANGDPKPYALRAFERFR